ncbi:MAG: tetratricopeptide repeat protein [Anaerolineae bacterium]|nr:tetratricopeptide repeat protein [Anaerolineae bacterium]
MPTFNQRLGLTRFEADEYYTRALDAYKKRDFDVALDAMNDAIELMPRKAEYLAARGFIFLEDGEQKRALDDFHAALVLNRYEMLAHYGRGMIAYQDQNWDEALAHFKDAFYADQNRPETLYYLGLTYYHKRDFASAIDFIERARQAFETANDRRKAEAERWLREIQRAVERMGGGLLPSSSS